MAELASSSTNRTKNIYYVLWSLLKITTLLLVIISDKQIQSQSLDNLQSNGVPISVSQSGEFRLPSRRVQDAIQNPMLMSERQNLMYPHTSDDLTEISSGRSMHDQALSFRLPFFGFSFEYIWVQRDGYLSFNKGMQTYKFPLKLPLQPLDTFIQEDPSIMAPFFAMQDIATEVPLSGVYFRVVNLLIDSRLGSGYYVDPEYELLRDRLLLDFREGMIGASDFVPKYAMIVTWRNMTIVNRRRERPLKTNTYQAVIATDEIRTYAMYNYEQIQWITHLDNYDGLKGSPAFVGFNAGNTTRTFEFNPYSQTQRVSLLPSDGLGNRLKGRYFFQLDEEVWPGSCINKKLEPNLRDRLPLTFFPRYGHMLGGTLVDVTGPCLRPDSIIFCRFDNFKSEAVYRDHNHATCISPAFMYHGYVDLTISVDGGIEFVGRYYVQPPDIAEEDVIVIDGKDYLEDPRDLELKWKPQKLSWSNDTTVTISLWGYRETMNVYPSLTYIDVLVPGGVRLGQGQLQLRLEQFENRDNWNNLDMMFGFIAINLTNPQVLGAKMRKSPIIWSRPMPLAWYFKPQWQRNYGYYYKDEFCDTWYQRESQADRFAPTIWRCPCTLEQVRIDRGRFSPDPQCNIIDRRCDVFHRDAIHCVNTGRPSIGGSGQTCCYDDQEELIQTADTMFGGRPSRAFRYGKHPFKTRMMTPTLSTWVHDVVPFFYCCKWQEKKDNSQACQKYTQYRTSQDCSLYQAPAVASVYGDPHMVTFNKHNYTFNGKGEYVLVHSDDPKVKFNVHARFEQVPRRYRGGAQVSATQLTAVAATDNASSIVEFRVRPLAARWRYQIYVLVDDQFIFWWDKSMQLQNFRGVTLYQPAGIQNMSHIIAMFDSGAGVEVMSINGFMTVHVYLPADFQGVTGGLLGNYSRKFTNEDLVAPNGARFNSRTQPDMLHNNFGQAWRLTETDKRGVGRTLLSHSSVRFALYDQPSFLPELRIPPELPMDMAHQQMEMEGTCGDSISCIYDFIVTLGDSWMASATRSAETLAMELAEVASKDIVRCPALPKPANGMKSENRYYPGRVVRFTCDTGYRLVGYEARYCRPDGLWSWGEEPECINEWRYYGIMFLSVLAALLPFVITLAAGAFCLMFMVRRSRQHHTGETGEEVRTFREKPPSDVSSSSTTNRSNTQRNLVNQFDDADDDDDDDDDELEDDDNDDSSEEDEDDFIDDIDDNADNKGGGVSYEPNRTSVANQSRQPINQGSATTRFTTNANIPLSSAASTSRNVSISQQQQQAQLARSNNIMRREFRTNTTSPQVNSRPQLQSGLPQRNVSSSKSSNISSKEVQI